MRMKQIVILLIGAILVFGSLPSASLAKEDGSSGEYSTKDETIYGNLSKDGNVNDMYVVNTFHIEDIGEIVDHGDYSDIRNLTNLSDMELNDNNVHFQAEKGDDDFNYQGFLEKKSLPWDIDITYKLDGEKMDPEKLVGKDGSLEIQIETSENDKDVDETFFENYMLQLTLTLDPESFDDVQAPDGTKAKEGKNTNVTFTGMPDEKGEFIVSAEVTDLEMDPIEISATPASMPIDDPDLGDVKSEMQSLSDAVSEINGGVSDLKGGISDLNDGASDLKEGSSSYLNGINDLDQSSSDLVSGSSEINNVFQQVSDAVQKAPDEMPDIDLDAFPDRVRSLADGLDETADEIDELRDNYDQANDKLDKTIAGIPDDEISDEQIEKLRNSDVDEAVIDQLVDAYQTAQEVKHVYNQVKGQFNAVTEQLNTISDSIRGMSEDANTFAEKIKHELNNMDGLDELDEIQSGLTDLASEYQSFHQGLIDYTDGVGNLAAKYQDIDKGIGDLADGSNSLEGGASDLQEGTEELKDKTSDIPDEMQSEVDEMLDEYDDSDFEPTSFVSDKNEDIDVVQFVLKTESIEVEEDDTTDDKEEEDKSIWERFLDLFR